MPDTKLIGTTGDGNTHAGVPGYFLASKFVAAASGTINQFRVRVYGDCNVKAGIYADSAGTISTRLWANNTGQACVAGWNNFTVSPGVSITGATAYWLAFNMDSSEFWEWNAGGVRGYASLAYGVGCPSPAPSLTVDELELCVQGWAAVSILPALQVNGQWKFTASARVMIGNAWKPVTGKQIKVNGVWRTVP